MISRYTIPMSLWNFNKSIREMSSSCSKFKLEVYRSAVSAGGIAEYKVKNFMGMVETFLATWEVYGKDLQKVIRSTDADKGTSQYQCIEYNAVKPFIFAAYDYASILQFTDGLVRGAKNTDITKDKDYSEFYRQVVTKAFKDHPADVGLMVAEVGNLTEINTNDHEVSIFKANRYKNFFDNSDRIEITKAVEKSIDYLIEEILNKDSQVYEYFYGPMAASAVNWIVEYVKTTLAAYACRTMAISRYVAPFICSTQRSIDPANIQESVTYTTESTFMKDIDESLVHSTDTLSDYVDSITEYFKTHESHAIGPDLSVIQNIHSYDQPSTIITDTNAVNIKLSDNPLYDYICDIDEHYNFTRTIQTAGISEFSKDLRNLKDFIISPNLGNGSSTSSLQNMIEVIKNIKAVDVKGNASETRQAYDQLMMDLICTFLRIAVSIKNWKRAANEFIIQGDPRFGLKNEIIKVLDEIYKTVGVATLFRCRDIEMRLNIINEGNAKQRIDELTIKIPGLAPNDYDTKYNNMSAVPDTNRAVVESCDILMLESALDQFNMYDEYVKSLPEMEGDWYYSEAFSFQDIVNKIKAILEAIGKKWNDFFNNASFKAAVEWCKKNGQAITSSKFNEGMNVLPYKFTETKWIDQLATTITNTDPKNVTDINTFTESLYADDQLKTIFTKETADNLKLPMYKNYVLFGNTATAKEIAVTADNLPDQVKKWVNTVSKASEIYTDCKNTNAILQRAIHALESKVLALKPEATTTTAENQTDAENEAAEKKKQEADAVYQNAQNVLAKTQEAINNLYLPLTSIVADLLKSEYKYIQEAWSKRVTPQAQAAQLQPTQANQ